MDLYKTLNTEYKLLLFDDVLKTYVQIYSITDKTEENALKRFDEYLHNFFTDEELKLMFFEIVKVLGGV